MPSLSYHYLSLLPLRGSADIFYGKCIDPLVSSCSFLWHCLFLCGMEHSGTVILPILVVCLISGTYVHSQDSFIWSCYKVVWGDCNWRNGYINWNAGGFQWDIISKSSGEVRFIPCILGLCSGRTSQALKM